MDLNADLGEECGDDRALMAIVTSANVATGAHAGGGEVLTSTVAYAVSAGIAVGAHPSYVDRSGFGRTSLLASHDASSLQALVRQQVLVVAKACRAAGGHLVHVKAHGALYHDLAAAPQAAEAFVESVLQVQRELGHGLRVVGAPHGALRWACEGAGLRFVPEAFADRGYRADGTLVARGEIGAVLTEAEAVAQVTSIAREGRARCSDGSWVSIDAETICVHGDTPGAVALAAAVRRGLESEGMVIAALESR